MRGSITCFTLSPSQAGDLKTRSKDGRIRATLASCEFRSTFWPRDYAGGDEAGTVGSLANAEAGDQLNSAGQMKSGGDTRGEIEAVDELASLVQGLAAAHEAGARIEGKPEGEAFHVELVLALGEIDFGQLADVDFVFGWCFES